MLLICFNLQKIRRLLSFKISFFLKIEEPILNEYSKNNNKTYDLNLNLRDKLLNQNVVGISINM